MTAPIFQQNSVLKTAFEATGILAACATGESPHMGMTSAGNLYEVLKEKVTSGVAKLKGTSNS